MVTAPVSLVGDLAVTDADDTSVTAWIAGLSWENSPYPIMVVTDDRFPPIDRLTRVHMRAYVTRAHTCTAGMLRNLSSVITVTGGRK